MNTDTSRTRRIGRFGAGAAIAGGTRLLLRRMAGDFERDHRLRPSTAVGVYGAYVVQLAAVTELVRHPRLRVPIPPLAGRVLDPDSGLATHEPPHSEVCRASFLHTGNRIRKHAPPSSALPAVTSPPWAWTSVATTASPMPDPPVRTRWPR